MFGAIAWGVIGGTQLDYKSTKSVPMQRGTRFLFFGVRSMVQHGVDAGVKNMYKINAIVHMFK